MSLIFSAYPNKTFSAKESLFLTGSPGVQIGKAPPKKRLAAAGVPHEQVFRFRFASGGASTGCDRAGENFNPSKEYAL